MALAPLATSASLDSIIPDNTSCLGYGMKSRIDRGVCISWKPALHMDPSNNPSSRDRPWLE